MNIKIEDKTLIFLSNETFEHIILMPLFEEIQEKLNAGLITKDTFMILLDESLNDYIQSFLAGNDQRKHSQMKGLKVIIDMLGIAKVINTVNFMDLSQLEEVIIAQKGWTSYLITQKTELANKLHLKYKSKMKAKIVQCEENKFVLWDFTKKQFDNAFFIPNNDFYINDINIDKIDVVYSEKFGYLKLDKRDPKIGGEATVYKSSNGLLVKIFHNEERRYETLKKLQKMVSMDIRSVYVNWPLDVLYHNNDFCGYVMKEITDAEGLDMSRIYSFNNLEFRNRVRICINLLKIVSYLHSKNILIGDMKFDNILLKNKHEVYIIDSGSFQIEDYSCGVYNAGYTSVELQGKNLREFLRSVEDEYFPINKILFEILIGKDPYYNPKSGEIAIVDDRKFRFPIKNVPEISDPKNPLFLWSNINNEIRKTFHDYFIKNIITDTAQWTVILNKFISSN